MADELTSNHLEVDVTVLCVLTQVRSNTVIDDKALLARAQAEIARLKLLLKHALGSAEGRADLNADVIDGGRAGDEMQRVLLENERLRQEVRWLGNHWGYVDSIFSSKGRREGRGDSVQELTDDIMRIVVRSCASKQRIKFLSSANCVNLSIVLL